MEALWRAKRTDGLRVIGINLLEPSEKVKAYVAEMKLTFPIVIDRTGKVAREYGVRGTPTHFLIDRSGVVRAAGSGSKNWNGSKALAAIDALLEAGPRGLSKAGPAGPGRFSSQKGG